MAEQNISRNKQEMERVNDLKITSRVLCVAFSIGCIFIWLRYLVPNLSSGVIQKNWITTGQTFTALLWGAAWFAAAFVFGFLFGIPKALQTTAKPPGTTGDLHPAESAVKDQGQLKVNTNLEEISDWLTKILVGATLTQLIKVPGSVLLVRCPA